MMSIGTLYRHTCHEAHRRGFNFCFGVERSVVGNDG